MPWLRLERGTHRSVLLVGRFALKVPRPRNLREGIACNRWEIRRASICEKYCPILAHYGWGFLIVMRRADPIASDEVDTLRDIEADPAFLDCYNSQPSQWLQGELKPDGLGVVDGRFVITDYGDD